MNKNTSFDTNKRWQSLPDGLKAIIVSILFVILGFLTLWLVKTLLKIQQDAVLVVILLVPVLIYLILSGKLQEISAGGVNAKFKDAAQERLFNIDEINAQQIETEAGDVFQKGRFRFTSTFRQTCQ